MSVLLTFLGRVPKTERGSYRRTRYDFGDGRVGEELAFFGWALQRRLRLERMVILGTRGSMWDHLFEGDLALGSAEEASREALIAAVENSNVQQEQLDPLQDVLSRTVGCSVRLVIIPYCRTEAEQIEVLRCMATEIQHGETVHIDVTHGFRHLPMLALLAGLYLQIERSAQVGGIWYGAYDPDTGQAPVYELSGLLRIAQGLQALAAFDWSGDYRVFADLLDRSGATGAAEGLRRAGYYENILNVGAATGELRKLRPELCDLGRDSPDLELLLPLIDQRIGWLDEDRQYEKQLALAQHALARSDYLRATLYAYEAVITRLCQQQRVDANDYEAREQARKDYEERIRRGDSAQWERYSLLKNLRNQVAHGTRGSLGVVQQCLLNESRLRAKLTRLIEEIVSGRLPAE